MDKRSIYEYSKLMEEYRDVTLEGIKLLLGALGEPARANQLEANLTSFMKETVSLLAKAIGQTRKLTAKENKTNA